MIVVTHFTHVNYFDVFGQLKLGPLKAWSHTLIN